MEYLLLGTIIDSFSLDGTMRIYSTTDNGDNRYKKGNVVFLYNPKTKERTQLTVDHYRHSGNFDYVRFLEIKTKEEIVPLKGFEIQVIKDKKDLKEGYYYFGDLRDCIVKDQNQNILGKVKEVEQFPSVISLRVKRTNNKEFLVPFLEQFIKKVDIENKEIIIELCEGML
ncbi:MAG: ribosome maturation factor RimM [Bacilli bacterium]|nr:ribosome maturation factor RimM [Bacilli bacterium]